MQVIKKHKKIAGALGVVAATAFGCYAYRWYQKQAFQSAADQRSAMLKGELSNSSVSYNGMMTFDVWNKTCLEHPKGNERFKDFTQGHGIQGMITWDEFHRAAQAFVTREQKMLTRNEFWKEKQALPQQLFNIKQPTFVPFVQRLVVPHDATVAFFGDLHGDVHSVNKQIQEFNAQNYMNGFKIIDDNFYLIFLGDYVDNGVYGVEAIYTMLRLKLENPNKVFMVRGNHEDQDMNRGRGRFDQELQQKFGKTNGFDPDFVYRLYDYMPVALYLGRERGDAHGYDFVLCCHGGLEHGFDPQPLLKEPVASGQKDMLFCKVLSYDKKNQGVLSRATRLKKLLENKKHQDALQELNSAQNGTEVVNFDAPMTYPMNKAFLGFLWSFFNTDPRKPSEVAMGGAIKYSKRTTEALLACDSTPARRVCGVLRAHQHSLTSDPRFGKFMIEMLSTDEREKQLPAADAGVAKLWIKSGEKPQKGQLWQNIVGTFAPQPCNKYGAEDPTYCNYSAVGLLNMQGTRFEDWKLKMIRHPMIGASAS